MTDNPIRAGDDGFWSGSDSTPAMQVFVYGDTGNTAAARVVWFLRFLASTHRCWMADEPVGSGYPDR